MGRPHKDVVVVVAWDAAGHKVAEDIVPRRSFDIAGSILVNSAAVRHRHGIRMISVRCFDEHGMRTSAELKNFGPDGEPVRALYRRPDGTIIEDSDRFV